LSSDRRYKTEIWTGHLTKKKKMFSVVTFSQYSLYILQLKLLFDWLVLMLLIQGCRFRSQH